MADPDISVILTAYNVEGYIERALQSALTQQGVTLEVIAVDDASTDGTWAAINRISDLRLKPLRLESNSGPGAARNAAIAQAQGAWLAVLDGDDMFLPGRLARCLARASHADIIVDNLTVYREADQAAFPMFAPHRFNAMPRMDLPSFIAGNLLFTGGYTLGYVKPLFSADFLRKHDLAYDSELRIGEDYLLLAEALACGARCAVEPSEGYRYTVRAGSISHRLSLADIDRMGQGDAKLLNRHTLSSAARHAQTRRDACLARARAFTLLIDALKNKDPVAACRAIASCPGCVWLLKMPIEARLQRLWRYVTG